MKLNNLIVLYDSNGISLDGKTEGVFDDNIIDRFKALNWNTILVKDGNSISSIDKAITEAKKSDKPTLIEIRTILGMDSLNEGTSKVHGLPLDSDDISRIKLKLNVDTAKFYVNEKAKEYFSKQIYTRSIKKYEQFKKLSSELNYSSEDIKINIDNIELKENESLRDSNSRVMKEIEKVLPNFIGGSADLSSSTKTMLTKFENFAGNSISFGVREHAMGSILNGLALSGYKCFGSTFLTFADYLKPAMRMTSLMGLPVTYVFTHDSISIGSDGPTHQPIEQLAMIRSIPNMYLFRPCDIKEVCGSWNYIINNSKPSSLALSRNEVKLCDGSDIFSVSNGGYVVRREVDKLHAILISTGSEVSTCVDIANSLYEKYKVDLRVVSMPCRELFLEQSKEYRESIIPKGFRTIVVEPGCKYGWENFVYEDKYLITLDQFGLSGTKEEVLDNFGFSYDKLLQKVISLLK